jgi:hypothetical protein
MSTNDDYAIYCCSSFGPEFGGCDIHIASGSNKNQDSFSDFGRSYKYPDYRFGKKKGKFILAGSFKFQTVEIEVFVATN